MKNSIKLLNSYGQEINDYLLNKEVWQSQKKESTTLNSLVYYCQNQQKKWLEKSYREKKKNRGEVSGGGKKPRRQKGLGMARQGSIRAPQWKGGGVCLGPSGDKKRLLSINKKSKTKALKNALLIKMNENQVKLVENININSFKTKEAKKILENIFPNNKEEKTTIIFSREEEKNKKTIRSFSNLSYVQNISTDFLNLPIIAQSNRIVITKEAFQELENKLK